MRPLDQRLAWWTLALGAGLASALGLGWIAVRLWAPEPSSSLPALQATMHLATPHLTHGANGTVLWEVEGDEASYDQASDTLVVTAPRIRYSGPTPVTVHASRGTVQQGQGVAELSGNLTAWFEDHTITAPAMRYHEADAALAFQGPVAVHGPRLTLDAPEARILLREERITASGGVRAILQPPRN